MFRNTSKIISLFVIVCVLFACAPSAYAQNSTRCAEEIERIELDFDRLESDYDKLVSDAQKEGAECAADLKAQQALRKALDVRLHDYEQAFTDEVRAHGGTQERLRATKRSILLWTGIGAVAGVVLGVVVSRVAVYLSP